MSKAAKALRRGSVRLRSSLGSGHAELNLVISELSTLRQAVKDCIAIQNTASRYCQKWALDEISPALQDVMIQSHELTLMWLESQKEYVAQLKNHKKVFEHILDMEKKVDQASKHLSNCEDKEKKLQKELLKGPKDIEMTKQKLEQSTSAKELAKVEVASQKRESEAVKLISIKAGLLDVSQSWNTLASKITTLGKAQKELALLIPDVHPRDDSVPSYTGARESSRIVYTARSAIDSQVPSYGTPSASVSPPPYSPPRSPGGIRKSDTFPQLQPPSRPPPSRPFIEEDYNYDSFDSD
ncbi:uncharacterized protein [Dysidea avara]|uniref:uncharacterized protein n=1 Tax=Dysidea avara TaxID=196820 RepID=UPI00332B9522